MHTYIGNETFLVNGSKESITMATQIKGLEGITLRLIKEFDVKKIKDMKNSLIGITEDGIISEDEKPELRRIQVVRMLLLGYIAFRYTLLPLSSP